MSFPSDDAEHMTRPDTTRIESVLRRIFPAEIVNKSIYFEQAVLADSNSYKSLGYRLFFITRNVLYYFDIAKSLHAGQAPISIPLAGKLFCHSYDNGSDIDTTLNSGKEGDVYIPALSH